MNRQDFHHLQPPLLTNGQQHVCMPFPPIQQNTVVNQIKSRPHAPIPFDQLVARNDREARQVLKAAAIAFPVTLRFLLRAETIRYLHNVIFGCIDGDWPVNGYRVHYILGEDHSGQSPEGTLTLQVIENQCTGHFHTCLMLLEVWDFEYFKPDQFWNAYYGGSSTLCIKTRHLVHERTVGMLIGVRGQQVDCFSLQHDCDIQVLGHTLPSHLDIQKQTRSPRQSGFHILTH